MSPRVSVIVPHYNDLVGLDACLTSLERQTRRPDEVVVADNNSPQGEAEIAKVVARRARLTIVLEKGAGPARNGGVAASTGDVLAFTDSDCLPEPEWLAAGLAALDTSDFAGGRMKVLVDDDQRMKPTEAFECVFAFDNEAYVLRRGFTVTANLFCSRKVFEAVGGFRVGVSEDADFCFRPREKGFRLGYAPSAVVGHPARRTWSELLRKWRRLNAEGYELEAERGRGGVPWAVKSLLMPVSAIAHTPKVLNSRAVPALAAKLGAIGVLYRLRLWRTWDSLRLLGTRE